MKTHEISSAFKISRTDVQVIADIIAHYSGTNIRQGNRMLKKVFGGDINAGHVGAFGYILGESRAADQQRALINNLYTKHGTN